MIPETAIDAAIRGALATGEHSPTFVQYKACNRLRDTFPSDFALGDRFGGTPVWEQVGRRLNALVAQALGPDPSEV